MLHPFFLCVIPAPWPLLWYFFSFMYNIKFKELNLQNSITCILWWTIDLRWAAQAEGGRKRHEQLAPKRAFKWILYQKCVHNKYIYQNEYQKIINWVSESPVGTCNFLSWTLLWFEAFYFYFFGVGKSKIKKKRVPSQGFALKPSLFLSARPNYYLLFLCQYFLPHISIDSFIFILNSR